MIKKLASFFHKKDWIGELRAFFFNQGLGLRIISYIGVLLIIGILLSFYINNEAHEKELMEFSKVEVHRLTDTIKDSIRHNMIRQGGYGNIQTLIETIGNREDIVKIAIIEKGKVEASSWREEIGTSCKMDEEGCSLCHPAKSNRPPLKIFTNRIYKDELKNKFIEVFNPILNEPICYQCHSEKREVLGILRVITSLSLIDKSILAGKKVMIISTIIIFLLVSLEIFYFIYRFVHSPIQKLTSATKRVASGDIDYQINIRSHDEIGELANSFNTMTEKLKKSWSEIEGWNHKLERRVKDATAKLRNANKTLQRTNNRLKVADQKKTEVLVTVAHDIRGPLSAIKSCISVILGGYLNNDEIKKTDMLIRADQRVEELLRFTNNLLDLSLLEESWSEDKEIDCSEIIETILPKLIKYAEKDNIRIKYEHPGDIPSIKGDKELITKAFMFITENAIKYSHPSKKVDIELSGNNGNISLMVKDQGIGIPEKELSCIFEPTFRGELAKRHTQSGTGISMALVERIIKLHKGNINIKSNLGLGTTITVNLPANGSRTAS